MKKISDLFGRRKGEWEDKVLAIGKWTDAWPSEDEYRRFFYSQEARDIAFKRYLEIAEETDIKACRTNMPDLMWNDPVLANHLLREAIQIVVKWKRPIMCDTQKEYKKRRVVRSIFESEDRARQENARRIKAEMKEFNGMISRERKRLIDEELKEQSGLWAKTKLRWFYMCNDIQTELEDEILGREGPVYNPDGWNLEQGRGSGVLFEPEYDSDTDADDEDGD